MTVRICLLAIVTLLARTVRADDWPRPTTFEREVGTGPKVALEVRAAGPNLSLFSVRRTHLVLGPPGSADAAVHEQFTPLCAAPCTLELAPDSYHFAVSEGLGAPLAVPAGMRVDRPMTIEVDYRARERMRRAGFVVLIVGSMVGAGLAMWGALYDVDRPNPRSNMALVGVGSGLFGASLVVGIVLGRQRDEARLRILAR